MNALASLQSEVTAVNRITSAMDRAMAALKANEAELRVRAAERIGQAIERGAARYERERDLPKLFPRAMWGSKSDGEIRDMLARAITAGSKALAAGHWAADGNRLLALRQALRAETQS